nr:hypothetical protein Iba_chr06eCG4310 [Ipomoea batatas]
MLRGSDSPGPESRVDVRFSVKCKPVPHLIETAPWKVMMKESQTKVSETPRFKENRGR